MDDKTLKLAKTLCGLPFDCTTCKYSYDMYMVEKKKCQAQKDAEKLIKEGYCHKRELVSNVLSEILFYCDTHKPLDENAFGEFLASLEERICNKL